MTKESECLQTGRHSFKCDYCKDNWHEACEDIMITTHGAFRCNCICNTPKEIPN